jgi:YHS domain-containing protein
VIARLLSWLFDALILYFIARAVMRLVQGLTSVPRPPRSSSQPIERSGGTLVRDPQCGTYVMESRAIRLSTGGKTLYFCSTACRDAYAART